MTEAEPIRSIFSGDQTMKSGRGCALLHVTLATGVVCLAFALSGSAQVHTKITTTSGKPTRQVKVERAEVLLVAGNDLVVKMEDGTIRHFADVPESFRATVGGKEVGIFDLKAGMTLERTTTITTTPKLVTTVQTVKGKVWHVQPPNYIYLTLEDGSNQRFQIPKGQKFKVEGQTLDVWGLKPGVTITANKIVEFTSMEIEQQRKLTGSMPVAAPALSADAPILVAK